MNEANPNIQNRLGVEWANRRRSRRLVQVLVTFVVFHMAMVLAYVLPVPIGPGHAVVARYVEPVFKQRWSVFAPDPVSTNTYLSVRARTASGRQTPWFGVTRCDVGAAIRHHPVPNRRYLTTFLLTNHYRAGLEAMPANARTVATVDASGGNWPTTMQHAVIARGATPQDASTFIKNERAMTNLVSQIARSRWGDVRSIQFEIKRVEVAPPAERDSSAAPKTQAWRSGEVPAWSAPPSAQGAVDAVYAPAGGC